MTDNQLQEQQGTAIQNNYTNDLNVLTAEIKSYIAVAKHSTAEAAGRLYHAKNNIFIEKKEGENHNKHYSIDGKEFYEWAEKEFKIKKGSISTMMQTYERFYLLGAEQVKLNSFNQGAELVHLPEEIWEEEFYTNKTNKDGNRIVKTPLEMSTREIRMLKQDLKEAKLQFGNEEYTPQELYSTLKSVNELKYTAEQKLKELETRLQEAQQAPPRVIEKIVEVENEQTRRELQRAKGEIATQKSHLERAQEQLERYQLKEEYLQKQIELQKEESARLKQMRDEYNQLRDKSKDLQVRIDDLTELAKFNSKVRGMLQNELAPMAYSDLILNYNDTDQVQTNVQQTIDLVKQWVRDMEGLIQDRKLPNKNTATIVNGEFIDM